MRRAGTVRGTSPGSVRPRHRAGGTAGAGPGTARGPRPRCRAEPSTGQHRTAGGVPPSGCFSRCHSRVSVRFPSVLAPGSGLRPRCGAGTPCCVAGCLSRGLSRLGTAGEVTHTHAPRRNPVARHAWPRAGVSGLKGSPKY